MKWSGNWGNSLTEWNIFQSIAYAFITRGLSVSSDKHFLKAAIYFDISNTKEPKKAFTNEVIE